MLKQNQDVSAQKAMLQEAALIVHYSKTIKSMETLRREWHAVKTIERVLVERLGYMTVEQFYAALDAAVDALELQSEEEIV